MSTSADLRIWNPDSTLTRSRRHLPADGIFDFSVSHKTPPSSRAGAMVSFLLRQLTKTVIGTPNFRPSTFSYREWGRGFSLMLKPPPGDSAGAEIFLKWRSRLGVGLPLLGWRR